MIDINSNHSGERLLVGQGGKCRNLYQCDGNLQCCIGLDGSHNSGYCYLGCNKGNGEGCSDSIRCGANLKCCDGKCHQLSYPCKGTSGN